MVETKRIEYDCMLIDLDYLYLPHCLWLDRCHFVSQYSASDKHTTAYVTQPSDPFPDVLTLFYYFSLFNWCVLGGMLIFTGQNGKSFCFYILFIALLGMGYCNTLAVTDVMAFILIVNHVRLFLLRSLQSHKPTHWELCFQRRDDTFHRK